MWGFVLGKSQTKERIIMDGKVDKGLGEIKKPEGVHSPASN
jgi:hypothetical protein